MAARTTSARSQRGFTLLVAAGLVAAYLAGVGVVLFLESHRPLVTEASP